MAVPDGSISRPVFMPEVYTTQGRGWSDWIEQFELAAGINGWDESVKLIFIPFAIWLCTRCL